MGILSQFKTSFLKIWAVLLVVLLPFYLQPSIISADALSDRIDEVSASTTKEEFVSSIINLSIVVGAIALVGLSSYAGFIMLTSEGNPEKLNEAREIILNAFLGFALIGLSVAILLLIQNVLNLPGVTP